MLTSALSASSRRALAAATGSKARTRIPAPVSSSIMARAGDSRMSSVLALKARPHKARVLPRTPPCGAKYAMIRSAMLRFCRSLTRSTASSSSGVMPAARAVWMSALTSFGKHDPPYPMPG